MTTDTDTTEAIAQAMYAEAYGLEAYPWADADPLLQRWYLRLARAAMRALTERDAR